MAHLILDFFWQIDSNIWYFDIETSLTNSKLPIGIFSIVKFGDLPTPLLATTGCVTFLKTMLDGRFKFTILTGRLFWTPTPIGAFAARGTAAGIANSRGEPSTNLWENNRIFFVILSESFVFCFQSCFFFVFTFILWNLCKWILQ